MSNGNGADKASTINGVSSTERETTQPAREITGIPTPTRRQALKSLGAAGGGSIFIPKIGAADGNEEFTDEASEWAPDWWKDQLTESTNRHGTVELVSRGVSDWISDNEQSPTWFTIQSDDELKYQPHGIFKVPDRRAASQTSKSSETTDFTTEDAKLCLPTSIDVGPVTVGLKACHHGGCKWNVELCYGGCIGTGMNDDCYQYYKLGGDLGVVDAELRIYPREELIGGSPILVGQKVTGELCYYYVFDSSCKNVSFSFNFEEESIENSTV